MEATARIELRRQRDFGGTVGVVFEFLRQNFIPLGKSILFLVGPLMVLVAILIGLYLRTVFGFMPGLGDGPAPSSTGIGSDVLSMTIAFVTAALIISLVTLTMMSAIINGYVVLYQEREPGIIGVDDVWRKTRSIFWRVMAAHVVLFALGIVMYAVVVLINIALGMWSLLLIPVFTGAIVYAFVSLSVVIPVCVVERVSVSLAVFRSFSLVKGRWWFTFGVHFVVALVVMFVNFAISMIFMQIGMIGGTTSTETLPIVMIASTVISTAIGYLLWSVLILTTTVVYFNLVEGKEGIGMSDRINEIGASLGDASGTTI